MVNRLSSDDYMLMIFGSFVGAVFGYIVSVAISFSVGILNYSIELMLITILLGAGLGFSIVGIHLSTE